MNEASGVSVASAQAIVEGEVRELVRRRQLDPVLEPEATRRLVDEVLSDYLDRAAMSALPPLGDAEAAARVVFDQVAGFGPLQQYFDDRWSRSFGRCVNRYRVGADRLMLNLRQQWNAMSTTKIALVGAFMGLVG